MKKIFSILLFLFVGIMTVNAQITVETVKGDVNNDGHFTIVDVSLLVDNLKTGRHQYVGQGSDMVVNDTLFGSWTTKSLECISFNADGTTTYGEGLTYQYRPFQGKVVFYDAESKAVDSLDVLYKTDTYIIMSKESNPTYTYYYKGSPVSGITLSQTTGEGIVGETCQLTATLQPTDVAFDGVTWSSSNTDVATVSGTGLVTFVASGEVSITATAADGTGVSSSCTFTVRRLVNSIALSDTSLELVNGETYTLSATVSPDNADDMSVTWSSSDETVARVSSKGKIITKQLGETTITCTANDGSGVSSICVIKVCQPITSLSLSAPYTTLNDETGHQMTITPVPAPSDYVLSTYDWISSDESVAIVDANGIVTGVNSGDVTITAAAKDGSGISATYALTIYYAPHDYVDLGLPSGTLWATTNVGADNPEDYGDYFAWGETTGYNSGKTSFSWSTYKYCNGSASTITKYSTSTSYWDSSLGTSPDQNTELDVADDAAYVNWGSDWRMPSYAQISELINSSYTTTTWTTQNGVYGRKITSKTNSNSIFLPAAGCRGYSSLNSAGSSGYFWSRTLYSSYSYGACSVNFNSSNISRSYGLRYFGLSVRPVLGAQN